MRRVLLGTERRRKIAVLVIAALTELPGITLVNNYHGWGAVAGWVFMILFIYGLWLVLVADDEL
ncbi:hypothetical protein [Actinomadura oligospora]|uniref:hypothetical protein n=1 Tax=Actinomadura oligospora TaxID=111804 RepID=UPI00047B03E2|nr:hypothetical protein [Actinomadura oligospora]